MKRSVVKLITLACFFVVCLTSNALAAEFQLEQPANGATFTDRQSLQFVWQPADLSGNTQELVYGTTPDLGVGATRKVVDALAVIPIKFPIGTYYWKVCEIATSECSDTWWYQVAQAMYVPATQCDDMVDNDFDGAIDAADPECAAGGESEGKPVPPELTTTAALKKARAVAARKFKRDYRSGKNKTFRCRKISTSRASCTGSWFAGDTSFRFRTKLTKVRQGARTRIKHVSSAVKINGYCEATGGSNCRKRWRWRG